MSDINALLTARQLQDLLQVERITVYRMLKDGRLRGFKVGGHWRFPRQDVERWLQKQQANLEESGAPPAADGLRPSAQSLPLSCIQAIEGILAEALGVGTVTTTLDGTPLTALNNACQFCELVQSTEAGRQRCARSWQAAAASSARTGRQTMECHAGLRHVWSRIRIQGRVVAVTHAGQFLIRPPDDVSGGGRMIALAADTGLAVGRLQAVLALVPVLDLDQLSKVQRLLGRVTSTFSEIGEERLALVGRLRRIASLTGY